MRTATSTGLTTGVTFGILVGIGIVGGIASRRADHPALDLPRFEAAPSVDVEIEPSSSTAVHESPAPPEGPFYASLFVAGATWTLPCSYGDREPVSMRRCHVDSVEVTGQTATARIACGYVHEGVTPDPAVNTYVMTPTGIYRADTVPSTRGEPMFTPRPVAKSLPRGWGAEEPHGSTWANAIVRHHGAWCTVDEFQSLDVSVGYVECISRHGIVGSSHSSSPGLIERCGDVPR